MAAVQDEEVHCGFYFSDSGTPGTPPDDAAMDIMEPELGDMKHSSSLQLMLSSIASERKKEFQSHNVRLSNDGEFVMVSREKFWVEMFIRNFSDPPQDEHKDDMLFYVRKTALSSKMAIPKTEIEVFRRKAKNLPRPDDPGVDWEETVYLNLILQHFEYRVTCAVCVRTGDRELQILKKTSQRVYASPSRRRMDKKGTEEEITYPNIYFTVDNFDEAFADITVRDSEVVCVELVARDRRSDFQGVVFLGSIRYDNLKQVYDKRASLSKRVSRWSWYGTGGASSQNRTEFVRMRGPLGKGFAEMAVSRQKGAGPETPDQTPSTEDFPGEDFSQDGDQAFGQRRMSDPHQAWAAYSQAGRHGYGSSSHGLRKSRSAADHVDVAGVEDEVEARDPHDELDAHQEHYQGFWGRSFGQAWHWFKERKRANSVTLHACLTYIQLPWHRIIADVTEESGPLSVPLLANATGTTCML